MDRALPRDVSCGAAQILASCDGAPDQPSQLTESPRPTRSRASSSPRSRRQPLFPPPECLLSGDASLFHASPRFFTSVLAVASLPITNARRATPTAAIRSGTMAEYPTRQNHECAARESHQPAGPSRPRPGIASIISPRCHHPDTGHSVLVTHGRRRTSRSARTSTSWSSFTPLPERTYASRVARGGDAHRHQPLKAAATRTRSLG